MINVGTIPENFSFTDVYTFHVDELPSLLVARRASADELIWDAEGGFTAQWIERSSVEGNPDDGYDFHIARRAFSVAGVPIFASGTASSGGGIGTLDGDVVGESDENEVVAIGGRTIDFEAATPGQVVGFDEDGNLTAVDGGTGGASDTDGVANLSTVPGATATEALDELQEQIDAITQSWVRVVDTNFTALPTQPTTADGEYVIDGVKYQVVNNARASAFGIINGTGFQISCNNQQSANYFLDPSTGPVLAIKLRDIAPGFVVGQSQVRMWCLAGSNGNQNHENCGFGVALYPWNGGQSTPNWYHILAFGAYDSLNPHNGVISGHGQSGSPTSRVDKDLTSVTVANDPTRSIWGIHFKDIGCVNYYTRSLPSSANNTDANDAITTFQGLSIRAQQRGAIVPVSGSTVPGYNVNQVQYLLDPVVDWRVDNADDIQLLIMAISTYNTSAHMVATLKRLVIEVKI